MSESAATRHARPFTFRHEIALTPENRQLVLFSIWGVLLGIIGAVTAWALYHLINIFTGLAWYGSVTTRSPLYPPPAGIGLLTIVVPVIGGLIVGVMAKYGTDRIRGHGIPEAMEAVLRHKSKISLRVAIFKPISAAIAVGTGGPFGAEGPIIQTGGAIGSLIGQTRKMSASERRILLACGGAAGMVGIFNTPIAAVALAIELLLFEFRARSLVPVVLASATAAACRVYLLGSKPMFGLGNLPAINGSLDLLWFVPLGIIIGVLAVVISKALFVIEEWFDRLHIDMILKPALGALVLGCVAYFQPRVLGMGYTYITETLQGHYANGTLLTMGVGKSIALVFSLGAGTSGGLLAPMLLIGATVGVGFGRGMHVLFPMAGLSPSLCGIVAMSSLFSAAARAPLTSFLFAFELTGDYRAILPLMVGCMIADVVARTLSSESVMTERLARRGLRIRQDYEAQMLQGVQVGEIMTRAVDTIQASLRVRDVLAQLLGNALSEAVPENGRASVDLDANSPVVEMSREDGTVTAGAQDGAASRITNTLHWHNNFPVVGEDGRLHGFISRDDLLHAFRDHALRDMPVGAIAQPAPEPLSPAESALAAFTRMLAEGKSLLPVVQAMEPHQLIGVLGPDDMLKAWKIRQAEEYDRERILRIGFSARTRPIVPLAPPVPEHVTSREKSESVLALHTRDTLTPESAEGDEPEARAPEESSRP